MVKMTQERLKEIAEILDADPIARPGCDCQDCQKSRAAAELVQEIKEFQLEAQRGDVVAGPHIKPDGTGGWILVDRKGMEGVYEALAYSQHTEPSIDPHSRKMAHRRTLAFCADALRSQAGGEG